MIKANCYLYNKKLDDLGVKTIDIKARVTILKSDVSIYRETVLDDEDEISETHCIVYTKNGESTIIDISYDESDKIMKTK